MISEQAERRGPGRPPTVFGTEFLQIRVNPETKKYLRVIAKSMNCSGAEIVRILIKQEYKRVKVLIEQEHGRAKELFEML